MKRIFFILLIACIAQGIMAQPQRRRTQQPTAAQQHNKSNANTITTRAQISFPTLAVIEEDTMPIIPIIATIIW